MEIKKLEDSIEELDVYGQGCGDDCADWSGDSASTLYGCSVTFSASGWGGW